MPGEFDYMAPHLVREGGALPELVIREMLFLCKARLWGDLEIKARSAVNDFPGQILGWKALSKSLLKSEKWEQALDVLSELLNFSSDNGDIHNDLGYVFKKLGRKEEAEACYRRALAAASLSAGAYSNLGALLADMGRLAEAVVALKRSIELNPEEAAPHCSLGGVFRDLGRPDEAEKSCRYALALDPGNFDSYVNLGLTLRDLGQFDKAVVSFRLALAINPQSHFALYHLGCLLERLGQEEEAIVSLELSVALNPGGADAYNVLGNILLRTCQVDKSWIMFRRAQELSPFITSLATKKQADFSVLLLDAPGAGSIPINYLIDRAPYDCHFYCVLPDASPDIEGLLAKADVVISLIADPDSGRKMLPFVHDIVERLGRPTLNPPFRVMECDRETVSRRLAGIPLCHIPKTRRYAGQLLITAALSRSLDGFTLPVLLRLAGNHGGADFEKFSDLGAVVELVRKRPEADYYLTQYVEYRSVDRFFRKYRMIVIDGELFPYHLAIHDDWKVHHFRTDMASHAWMRKEEEAFLRQPHLVFGEPQQEALRGVAKMTGLDYCGIDCALEREGAIVVFETNAAMLVHDEKDEMFSYKNPYIARIKNAFHARLARMAQESRASNT
jgi:tetratricopeptide (TPR) repeat protein/glutathione synthase/RimK-type ligase-like ATP-grasp enzyme